MYAQDDHKVTAEELSMIVDELSDDEGDEDEGLKGRLEQQRLDDKAQTRQIIAAITEVTTHASPVHSMCPTYIHMPASTFFTLSLM